MVERVKMNTFKSSLPFGMLIGTGIGALVGLIGGILIMGIIFICT